MAKVPPDLPMTPEACVGGEASADKVSLVHRDGDLMTNPCEALPNAPDASQGWLPRMDKEIFKIALPMLVALATDPIAGLVDTAFIGRIGAVELAGMGVALSIFNTVAKFLNVPLVSATTTAVAKALGAARAAAKARQQEGQAMETETQLFLLSRGDRSTAGAVGNAPGLGAREAGETGQRAGKEEVRGEEDHVPLLRLAPTSSSTPFAAGGEEGHIPLMGQGGQDSSRATEAAGGEEDDMPFLGKGASSTAGYPGQTKQGRGNPLLPNQEEQQASQGPQANDTNTERQPLIAQCTDNSTTPTTMPTATPTTQESCSSPDLGGVVRRRTSIAGDKAGDETARLLTTQARSDKKPSVELTPRVQTNLNVAPSLLPAAAAALFEDDLPLSALPMEAVASAASAALVMAVVIGMLEAVAIAFMGGWAVQLWGLSPGSPGHTEGIAYLRIRACTIPFTVLLLALQGVFRGLGDTRAPLVASLAANTLNVALAPLLIFQLGWGVKGAAAAQGLAQVLPTLALLHYLSRKINIVLVGVVALRELLALLKPTGFLLLRTASVTSTYALATSAVAHQGAAYAAAHQVATSVWLALSLLADALAVAAQSLIARYTAEGDPHLARQVADRCVLLGGMLGVVVGGLLGLVRGPVARIFTTDSNVLAIVKVIMPILICTQPINMLAFVLDGVLFGAGGFKYASFAMAACAVPALSLISVGMHAATPTQIILWVWMGLTLLMLLRALTIFVPYNQRLGPFRKLLAPGEAQGVLGRWAARVRARFWF